VKNVLIIANEFPPIGGSGVQRSVKFAKYLPQEGYNPIVITKAYAGGLYDESLLKDLPSDLVRFDLPSVDLLNQPGLIGKIKRAIGTRVMVPDGEYFWYLKNRKRVLEILDQFAITLIYSTSYPYSDHLLGLYLKKKRPHMKWVVDFRDEWTNNPYHSEKWWMKVRYPLERRMELTIVNQCDYLITNTPFMLENFLRDTPSIKNRSAFIPNGFDESDFQSYTLCNQDNQQFVMMYSGALYGRRRPDFVLQALSELILEGTINKEDLRLDFIGNFKVANMESLMAFYKLQGLMHVTGYMKHNELLGHMAQANLLLLIESEKNFYTGKVFEYIKLGMPILATVPLDGAAASVVRDTNTGNVVDVEDVGAIKQSLIKYYSDWKRGKVEYAPNLEAIKAFSRQAQTNALAKCFDSCI
jgi:glycosyltransferase involved in cell wall biosynthesis